MPAPAHMVLTPQDHEFLAGLREKFGASIRGKHAQIKMIEQLIAYLMERYPDDWRERVREFLALAFPQLVNELFAKFEQLVSYNDWLRANRSALLKKPAAERRAALWAQRRETFGADATEIFAAELRNQNLGDAIAALDTRQDLNTQQKLGAFITGINQAYGDQAAQFIEVRGTELMNRFLDLPSIQTDLQALNPTQRSAALNGIRSGLGMDAPALERWSALDQQRDTAWDAGQQYMQERARIVEQYQGQEQSRKLAQLQEQAFGAEAETLRSEEQGGFFRYAERRRIGRE